MSKNRVRLYLMTGLMMPLYGCMSGLGGSSHFNCKAPEGVTCQSVSGVYANSVQNNLPGQQTNKKNATLTNKERKALQSKTDDTVNGIIGQVVNSGDPLRTAPVVNRVWLAPWTDKDGDLHDQEYIYMVTDTGHWRIEHNTQQIVSRYAPTFLRTKTTENTTATKQDVVDGAKKTAADLNAIYENATKIIKLPEQGGSNN